jgi:4-alpha-glucanotransferase/alpha-amylase
VLARWRIRGAAVRSFRTTLDFAMPSCDGFSGRYIVGDSIPCGFGQALDVRGTPAVVLDDRFLEGGVALECVPPARVSGRPYFTVSQSEDGFERVMQSATVVLEWDVAGEATFELALRVRAG